MRVTVEAFSGTTEHRTVDSALQRFAKLAMDADGPVALHAHTCVVASVDPDSDWHSPEKAIFDAMRFVVLREYTSADCAPTGKAAITSALADIINGPTVGDAEAVCGIIEALIGGQDVWGALHDHGIL